MNKIAIIGAGPMGIRHLQAIKNLPNVQLVGLVDLNQKTLDSVCSKFGLTSQIAYISHLEMLEKENPVTVIIATNGPSHFRIFSDVVLSGVRKILCEKPIATSVKEAQMMIEMANEQGVSLQVNHVRRWSEDYNILKKRLKGGLIGEIESIYSSIGGGQMACNGTHMIDLAGYLFDAKPKQVIGFLNDKGVVNPRGEQFTDPGGYALIHFDNNKRMFFENADDLGIPPYFVINGTYGRVIIEETKRFYTLESRKQEDRKLPLTRYGTPLIESETIEFVDMDIIRLCEKAITHLIEGVGELHNIYALNALETIIGIHYSHANENKAILLPLTNKTIIEQKFSFT